MSDVEQPLDDPAEDDPDVEESELDSDETPDEEESDAVLPPEAAS